MLGQGTSAQQFLEKLDKGLEQYEQEVGLPAYQANNEVHEFLNLRRDQLTKLSPEHAGEGAYLLRQYAFHLQRAYNREVGKVNVLDSQVRKTVAGEVGQYRAPSADERRDLAIAGNEHARALKKHRDWHQARADRVAFLSRAVSDMAHSLEELAQSKRRNRS